MTDASPITAVLGPTNTGKTHRAIERLLEHPTGMMGLPLRLLAREVYDRVTARIGESRVALVTGEEKRIPKRPAYWICTVEAMPMEREVDFIAIDEVQLAAHPQRGHVFTERLLGARGRKETWLLGADTMRPLLAELLPHATIASHPRLSRLTSEGPMKLSRIPPRSAVVGFSMTQVYELAERLRAKKGGAAVVLGALSPRTRNAQVALFQSGEVDYLVATDAIGMGLNLDVGHVAFAALRKFDGKELRELELAELGQIAGRAGRHVRDGTFGTVAPLALSPGVTQAIEAHQFDPVRRVYYRNADLDFASIDALFESLRKRPKWTRLIPVADAEDTAALTHLSRLPEVRSRAVGPERVELLWDICRIPDYRKLLFESHVALLAELYGQLTGPRGKLDADWVGARIAELDDPSGDIDTLVDRIAAVRTYTYVANQAHFLGDAETFQERTRAIEDRLSDALHERIVQRFVERRGPRRAPPAPPRSRPSEPGRPEPPPSRPSHPFAALASLYESLAPTPAAAPRGDGASFAASLVAAPHAAFSVLEGGRLAYQGEAVGVLSRGGTLLLPEVRVSAWDGLGAGARSQMHRRLVAFARDLVAELLAPLRDERIHVLSAAARGLLYQLERGLGTALRDADGAARAPLTEDDTRILGALGVRLGARVLDVPALREAAPLRLRFALVRAYFEASAPTQLPPEGAPTCPVAPRDEPLAYAALGYPVFGPRGVRADLVERVHDALETGAATPRSLAALLRCELRDVEAIATRIGAGAG